MQDESSQIQSRQIFQIVSGILLNREEKLQADEIEKLLRKLMDEHNNLFTSENIDIKLVENRIVELIPTIKIEIICHKLGFYTDDTIVKTLIDIFFTEEKYFTPQIIKLLLVELIKIQPERLSKNNINIESMQENLNNLIENDLPRLVQEESKRLERERTRLYIVRRMEKNRKAIETEWHQDDTEEANDPPEAELQETRTPPRPRPVPPINLKNSKTIFSAEKKARRSPNSPTSSTNEAAKTELSPRRWARRIKNLHKSGRPKARPLARSGGFFRPSRKRSSSTKKTGSIRPDSARGRSLRPKSRGKRQEIKRTNSTSDLNIKY